MTSRGQCPRGGGGACGYLCKISGKSTPLPPLTKAFPYAYGAAPVTIFNCDFITYSLLNVKCIPQISIYALAKLENKQSSVANPTPPSLVSRMAILSNE